MSDFVEQCRREWRRLGVPAPQAEEMATDLSDDLADARAEGVSPEEFLGASVFDPTSFAAEWARERGVIPVGRPAGDPRRRPRGLVAFTLVAGIVVVVTVVLLVTGEPHVSLVTTRHLPVHIPSAGAPSGVGVSVVTASAAAPIEWLLLAFALVALWFAGRFWWRRDR